MVNYKAILTLAILCVHNQKYPLGGVENGGLVLHKIYFLLAGFLIGSAAQVWAEPCGKIESMNGDIEILRLKDSGVSDLRTAIKAQAKDALECSDIVVSGKRSRAKLRLGTSASMTIGPNSRLELLEFIKKSAGDASQLRLTYGKVRALFNEEKSSQKGQKSSRFIIKTPSAVAGVRGTDFYVGYQPTTGLTSQATISGKVEVEQVETGKKVLVESGKQVQVEGSALDPSGKVIPVKSPEQLKPPTIETIAPEVAEEIRQTSVLVKSDPTFTSPEAVKVLGAPVTWKPAADEVPMDLKNLKEEF